MNNKAHKNISFSPSLPTLADLRAFFRAHDWSASSLSSPSSRSPDKQSDMEYVKRLLEAISDISDFIRCYEHVFMAIVKKRNNAGRENDIMVLNATLVNGNKRIKEIDRKILQAFEANADGKLDDDRYMTIVAGYEAEQKSLKAAVASAEEQLAKAEQQTVDMRMFMKGIREFTEMKVLTPEIANTLIKRIEVHNNDKYDGHCHVKVDIYFTAIGMFSMPTEEELREQMAELTESKGA